MKKKPTNPPLSEEYRLRRLVQLSDTFTNVVTALAKYGCLLGIAYFVYLTISSLSGKETFANIVVNLLSDLEVSEGVAYIFGGGALFYGWAQRGLRKKRVAELSQRLEGFERSVDSNRSSSGLKPDGTTARDK